MREIRLYGSEGGGAVRSPYPYQGGRVKHTLRVESMRSASETLVLFTAPHTAPAQQPKCRTKERKNVHCPVSWTLTGLATGFEVTTE